MNRVRVVSALALSLFSFAIPCFAEVKLPLTGRAVDMDFAERLAHSDRETGIAELKKAGVRVLSWNADKRTLAGEDLSDVEKVALPAYLEKIAKFMGTSLGEGFESIVANGTLKVAQNTIILKSQLADKEVPHVLAHEWLHLVLMKSPSPILGEGKIPPLSETSKALKLLKQKVIAQGVDLNPNPTAEYFAKNAERYQTVMELQYAMLLGQISTLCDEWDIHLQMILSRLSTKRVAELALIAEHLEKRIDLANDYAASYRRLGQHRALFTESTKVYGDATVSLALFLEGLVEKYFAQVEKHFTQAEQGELGSYAPARSLFKRFK